MRSSSKVQQARMPDGQHTVAKANMLRSIFFISNIHCASCVAFVREVLSQVQDVKEIDVSILTHEVRVFHGAAATSEQLASALSQAAFEVHHVTTYNDRDIIICDFDFRPRLSRAHSSSQRTYSSQLLTTMGRRDRAEIAMTNLHIANCDACKQEQLENARPDFEMADGTLSSLKNAHHMLRSSSPGMSSHDSVPEKVATPDRPQREPATPMGKTDIHLAKEDESMCPTEVAAQSEQEDYMAFLSIGGMSCASCANNITDKVKEIGFVTDATVNLFNNSACVTFSGQKADASRIVEQIEDIGFEASLVEVNGISRRPAEMTSSTLLMQVAITGMTCGSCVGTITRGLQELPFVKMVAINLLSHSGQIEFEGQENRDKIVETIEDLGYDATVMSVSSSSVSAGEDTAKQRARTLSIRVEGMYCHHCPQKVVSTLREAYNDSIVVQAAPSVQTPILEITYTPKPPSLTIRKILSIIEGADPAFKAIIHQPPNIEDRSRAMHAYERRRLLSRLIFVLLVAIPTFLIGIVFMSLVPQNNYIRMWLGHPVWAGNVSRVEWALFIMTTPVMFYGTDLFHVRAATEIYGLWRPGSRVPYVKRFLRFGSMNLLVSAGTMVAFVSSLAVLVVDAAVQTKSRTPSSTYFDSVVFLTLFILAGRYLEAYSKAKTGDAVASLGSLRPSEALLVEETSNPESGFAGEPTEPEKIIRVDVNHLEIGDIVRIPHGVSPPADGYIVDTGSYQFDESSLTGESKPVHKSAGDQVFTGSVNAGAPVNIRVSGLGGSSMLDQIIAIVREGQSKRAPLERVADLLTGHFVPVITLIAVSTFIIWLALGQSGVLPADYLDAPHGGWTFWSLEFAIAVFVVACPCGLALAAPTALFVGGGLAAKHGILVKGGGEAFQEASRLDAIIFDKTGTLTEGGSLQVSDHEVLIRNSEELQAVWALAQKLEESSNHPLARAIAKFCEGKMTKSVQSLDTQEIPGRGMKGTFMVRDQDSPDSHAPNQIEAAIGSQRLIESLTDPDADHYFLTNLLTKYQSAGKSTAILFLRKTGPGNPAPYFTPAVVFATLDTVRAEAAGVISQLRNRQIDVYMCTGDNETTAYAVADALGIPRSKVKANVMPGEKADFVRQVQETRLQDQHSAQHSSAGSKSLKTKSRSIVAFVGDGVNDSPALAAADVSVAMASGTDVAINTASFILLNSDLSTILQLVVLSRRVFNRVRMNFGWALVYNLCLIPVAAGVLYPIVTGHRQIVTAAAETVTVDKHWRLSPVWAALAMALSSISVVSSSLALRVERKDILKLLGIRKRR